MCVYMRRRELAVHHLCRKHPCHAVLPFSLSDWAELSVHKDNGISATLQTERPWNANQMHGSPRY
jgi:hypothetical protein